MLALFLNFALAAASTPVADCGGPNPVLTGQGVGAVRIGTPVKVIKQRCLVLSDRTIRDENDEPARTLRVKVGGSVVEAEIYEGKVWRVLVNKPGLRTKDGFGVGTALTELLRQPGLSGDWGEGDVYVFTPRLCGVSFHLAYKPTDRDYDESWTSAHLARLPRSTKVGEVLLFGCGKT